ncbi:MAG: hypothetical protein J6S67_21470 [Methanobrevibacter sp.]|nr:hypothetical protein [Methanobrevibacter sp.]
MLYIDNDNNITLTRSDNATLELTVKDDGMTYDFSNDLVQFTVKRNTVTETVIFQKTFTAGVILIEPSDTSTLNYTDLVYDVQLIKQGGGVYTVIPPRKFTIAEEVNFNVTG